MARGSGVLVLALVAALLGCDAARQELEGPDAADGYDPGSGARQRQAPGGRAAGAARQLRAAQRLSAAGRRAGHPSALGGRGLRAPVGYAGFYGDGLPKRNFDEIDRSNLNTFVKKRNFDEIDQTSMPFPFKRFFPLVGHDYLELPLSNLDKKRHNADYPMDEIDFSHFPIGSKRSPS